MSNVKLDSTKTTFDKLEEHYRGFIAPCFKITINNKDIVREGMAIEGLNVQSSVHKKADMANFTVSNAFDLIKRDFLWTDILKLGNPVEISFGYTDRLTPVFFGYVANVNFDFGESSSPTISINAMDISFFMMRGSEPKIWANKTISDIAKEIGRKYGVTKFEIDSHSKVFPELVKTFESDHDFLSREAKKLNYDFFVVGKTLYFRKKRANKIPVIKLEWGKQLKSFNLVQDIGDQVTKVIVRATLRNEKKTIISEASSIEKIGRNTRTGANILSQLGSFPEVIQMTVEDENEAKELASSRMQEISEKLVKADASCIGLPELRAGRKIELSGLGKYLNNEYDIVETTHLVNTSGYITKFKLQGNAV